MTLRPGWLTVLEDLRHIGFLFRGVDVFDLGSVGELILIAGQTTEEDSTSQHQDGGTPAKAVCPRVVIITFIDQLVELDWIDDQSDDLDDYWNKRNILQSENSTTSSSSSSNYSHSNLQSITLAIKLKSHIKLSTNYYKQCTKI